MRARWIRAVLLVGAAYALVGIVFALPASHARFWRLSAWVVSAVVFAAHMVYEHFRLKVAPRPAAFHVALAVVLGSFGLALGANVHAVFVGTGGQHRRLLLLALAIWPVLTGLPALVVAWVVLALGARFGRR